MPTRSTSLTNASAVGIGREIGSQYDNVKIVADSIAAVQAIANSITIGTFDAAAVIIEDPLRSSILNVAANNVSIVAVANNELDISTVAGSIASINTLAPFTVELGKAAVLLDNVAEVLGVHASLADVTAVAGSISDVNSVGTNIADVVTTASSINNVNVVADNVVTVNLVASYIQDIIDVAGALNSINTILANMATITNVGDNIGAVTNVSGNIGYVTAVANDEADIGTVALNSGLVQIVGSDLANEYVYIEDNGTLGEPVQAQLGDSLIRTVAESITNVNAVGTISADVATVATNTSDIQLLADNIDGTISSDISLVADNLNVDGITGKVQIVADNIGSVNTVSGISADVTTVAGISTDVTAVSGVSGNVTTVATNIANVNTTATNIANVNTVAGVSGNVTTVAGIAPNVTSVAGIASDVAVVAANIVDVQNAEENAALAQQYAVQPEDTLGANTGTYSALHYAAKAQSAQLAAEAALDAFDDRYLGSFVSDPTLDNDGNPLTDGAIYFNTSSNELKVYDLGNVVWLTIPQIALATLNDVTLTSITTGDILKWTGTEWVNTTDLGTKTVDSLQFTGGTLTQGTVTWNTDEETLDLIQNGATLQLGQELQVHVRNSTGTAIANGTVVMATGTIGNSGRITVAPYDNVADVKYIVGVTTEDIGIDEDGKVTSFGKVRGVDTQAWAEGAVLYTTAAGGLTTTEPTTGIKAAIAFVVTSAANGTLMVRTTPHNELTYHANLVDMQGGTTGEHYHLTAAEYGSIGNWNTAYGWGDHASAGYLQNDLSNVATSFTLNLGNVTDV